MPRTNQRVVLVFFFFENGGEGGDEVVQFAPHGGTEVLLVSEHCLADCPHRLPVFFCFTVHCLPVSRSVVEAGDKCGAGPPLVQMAILTAQKTAPLCHPLPPGAFAIFFNQPLHSGWVATVCTVLAGAVWLKRYASWTFQAGFCRFVFLMNYVQDGCRRFCTMIVCKTGGKSFKSVQLAGSNGVSAWVIDIYPIKPPCWCQTDVKQKKRPSFIFPNLFLFLFKHPWDMRKQENIILASQTGQ